MQLRWPQGFRCPRCEGQRTRRSRRGLLRCGTVRLSGFGDGRHDFPGHASAAAHLVSGDVVGDEPEKRGECSGTAKHFGSGKLPHRLGVAAQAAARDGAAWPRTAQRPRRGRRDLCWGRRRGTARTADAEKGTGSHRRGRRRCGARKDPHEAHPSSFQAPATRLHPRGCWNPTAPSTPTAGKVTSVWRRLAIGTNTTFWQLPANQPLSCCLVFTVWLPC